VLACMPASLASLPCTLAVRALTETDVAGSVTLPQPARWSPSALASQTLLARCQTAQQLRA